jgi:hypothetical protein
MILLYGECRGNGNAALRLYAERFPTRRQPNHGRVIVNTLIRLRNNNPPVPINRGGAPQLHVREEEHVLDHFHNQPGSSTRRAGRILGTGPTAGE